MKKRLLALAVSVSMLLSLTGCSGNKNDESGVSSEVSSEVSQSSAVSEESSVPGESESDSSINSTADNDAQGEAVRIAALKGPTAMGMVQMMEETGTYDFTLAAAPDEVTPLIIQGQADIAAVPANLASVLYNKTQGGISVIDINTLGVLYILENGNTVKSVADLKGKTIFASGKGATPEFALNYMLTQNGIDPQADVTIEYKTEHTECVAALTSTENSVAMLPQPFAAAAQTQNENIQIVLDMTKEWEQLADQDGNKASLVTGVTIVRTEFLEEHPEAVAKFLEDHAQSTDFVTANPADASLLMEKYDIVAAPVAEKAIPYCNITCVTGDDMKEQLSSYLSVLSQQSPESIGGTLPDDSFYFKGK